MLINDDRTSKTEPTKHAISGLGSKVRDTMLKIRSIIRIEEENNIWWKSHEHFMRKAQNFVKKKFTFSQKFQSRSMRYLHNMNIGIMFFDFIIIFVWSALEFFNKY